MNVGIGVTIEESEGKIIITLDSTADFGLSASGKSHIVGSTKGNVTLPSGVTIGVNAYRKA